MRRLRWVLFDVDGTLLDTAGFIFAAFEHVARDRGLGLPPRADLAREIGRPLDAIYADLACREMVPGLVDQHRSFQEANLGLIRVFPGVREALAELRAAGFRMGAVTSRSRRTSAPSLEQARILHLLDVVIAAEDAPALKPDPAPLRLALGRLGATPAESAMVGDTRHDIEAGRALGMWTVAATYGMHGEAVLDAGPDRAIATFAGPAGIVAALTG